jgi:hypothetical protein
MTDGIALPKLGMTDGAADLQHERLKLDAN